MGERKLITVERQVKVPRKRKQLTNAERKKEYEHLREVKEKVRDMERENVDSIILFASTNGWFKMGFRSNTLYHFYVAPYLKETRYKNRPDTDRYFVSKTGITSIPDVVAFAEEMLKRGATIPKSLEKFFVPGASLYVRLRKNELKDIYIFKFEGLTDAEMDTFLKAEEKEKEDLNKLVMPFYIPQNLYTDLHKMSEMVMLAVTHFPTEIRELYGKRLVDETLDILSTLNLACNGYKGEEGFRRALNHVVAGLAVLQEALQLMLDCKFISYGMTQQILIMTSNVRKDVIDEAKKMNADGDPVIKAIKRAKNMPKNPLVDIPKDKLPDKSKNKNGFIQTRPPQEPEGK